MLFESVILPKGYRDDRQLLGFRIETSLSVSRIALKAETLILKAGDDAPRIAVLKAAAARLIAVHDSPQISAVPYPETVPVYPVETARDPVNVSVSANAPALGRHRPAPVTPATLDLEPCRSARRTRSDSPVPVPVPVPIQPERSLLDGFPRGDPDRRPEDIDPAKQAPFAAFTATAALRSEDVRWQDGRLFLGVVDGVEARFSAGQDGRPGPRCILDGLEVGVDDDRHVCTFAGSRAGKGRSAIVPNLLRWSGSVMAIDPKGELAVITARRRRELGDVRILDPFGVAAAALTDDGLTLLTGFNPIAAMRDGHLIEDAAMVADAIVVPGGNDPHWADSARTFIEGLALHVRTEPRYANRRDLFTLRELAGQGPDKGGIVALIAEMKANAVDPTGVVAMAAVDYAERPAGEQGSMLSTVRRHLKFIDLFRDSQLGRMTLEYDGFRLDALKRQVTTVYLCLPARHLGTCSRWLRLFVNLMLQAAEETRVDAMPGDAPMLCVMDEFASLGYMKQIEDAAAQVAGFGVKLWPILQDIGQLKALYGERWETFLANSGIVQVFGNSDLTTLEWVSKRLGTTLVQLHRRGGGRAAELGQGPGDASGLYDLMTPEEVARFFGRDDPRLRQLVIWAGRRAPFLVLQRAFYDQHRLCRYADGLPMFDPPP